MRRVAISLLVIAWLAGHAFAQTPVPVPVTPDPNAPKSEPPEGPTPTPVPVEPSQVPAPAPEPPVQIEKKVEQAPSITDEPQEIREIIVEDNTKTTSETVELIAGLEIGDPWTPDMVDLVKSRLISSGLFKDVEVYWTRSEGGVAVHLLAKDKHSWVIAPAFYNQPTNTGGGIGFGENNLFGENQKLLLYAQIATGDSFFIGAWVIPSIAGSRISGQLDTFLKSARNIEYKPPNSYIVTGPTDVIPVRQSRIHYLNAGGKIGIRLWRAVHLDTRLRAAKVSYKQQDTFLSDGASPDDIGPGIDPNMPPPPGEAGWDVSNEWFLTIDRRANYYGVQDGFKYVIDYEHSLPSLGSDFRYWLITGSAFKAVRILDRHNLIAKTSLGIGRNMPFQAEYTSGGTSMRGWLNSQFRGDFKWTGNVEYSVPMFTIKGFSVRGLTFWDSAYTTFLHTDPVAAKRNYLPGAEARGLAPFKNSVGVGTRFYLRQIVLPLLGLDFGYGLEARDFQVYLAIGLTD